MPTGRLAWLWIRGEKGSGSTVPLPLPGDPCVGGCAYLNHEALPPTMRRPQRPHSASHQPQPLPGSHLLVVLPEVGQLLVQALSLQLQVGLCQGQLVQHPAQAVDVSLHALAQGQLVLIPGKEEGTQVRKGEGSGPLESGDGAEGAYLSLKSSAANLALSISRITRELSMVAARICRRQGAGF